MIISQEKAFLKAQTQLQEICRFVEQAASDGRRRPGGASIVC